MGARTELHISVAALSLRKISSAKEKQATRSGICFTARITSKYPMKSDVERVSADLRV